MVTTRTGSRSNSQEPAPRDGYIDMFEDNVQGKEVEEDTEEKVEVEEDTEKKVEEVDDDTTEKSLTSEKRGTKRPRLTKETREEHLADTLNCLMPESCLLYTSPSPRDATLSRMPSSA